MFELETLDPNVLEVTDADVDMFELVALEPPGLLCRLGPSTLANIEGLSALDEVCDFGVSGICSESWSNSGVVSSTLVAGEDGSFEAFVTPESGRGATGIACTGPTPVALSVVALVGALLLSVVGTTGVVDLGVT